MEEGRNVVNHFEAGSNCQVFNAPISGCVFAMPGSNVTQVAAKQEPEEKRLSDEQLAKAIEESQAFFWGNSAYAVLFCLLRDEYGIADNMSMFEAKVEKLPYSKERSFTCPKGTIVNAFSNNPIYRQHIDKWKDKANIRILKLLEALKLQLEL
jgi:hypothetical protein